ncbi:MAG: hypothetical protein GY936_08420 [Ignavibacteriae bacterium]|nr:hypothetical protein [Ignavibacteriota bacterium]
MKKKTEPWYIHTALYVVIAILSFVLIKVAIINPTEHIDTENYNRTESQLRMENIRQAQILWEKENEIFSDNLAELVDFVKTDSTVNSLITGVDTLTNRSTNPFKNLTDGSFTPDSLLRSPATNSFYSLKIDTTTSIDTVIDRSGKLVKVDTVITIGDIYLLTCPDGYGTIGDLESPSLKNTASWD